MKRFLYIVDSYLDDDIHPILEEEGFVDGLDYSYSGSGGSAMLFQDPKWIGAEKLLVFTGSFHGSVERAEEFARNVKRMNPRAKVVFRSDHDVSNNPVFDTSIRKTIGEFDTMMKFIREYFGI